MRKNLKRGASSIGGTIGIVIVVLVLLFGAYYFWKYKIEPRFDRSTSPTSTSTDGVIIKLDASTT